MWTRLGDLRKKEREALLELVRQDYEATEAMAIKIRAGRGDNLGHNNENAPGRTEKLIRMVREMFGDGTYDVKEAIRIGKILEEHNYYFYEEPIPWECCKE